MADRCCWVCTYRQKGGVTRLGNGLWFETQGKPKKPIPPAVVDVGCTFWKGRAKVAPVVEDDGVPDGH